MAQFTIAAGQEQDARQEATGSFARIRRRAETATTEEISLDEINEEIRNVRHS